MADEKVTWHRYTDGAKDRYGSATFTFTDEEILAAYHLVAKAEGVFVEPASAASIAGLLKSIEDGWVKPGSTVVCTVTGNGLKDPDNALKGMPEVKAIPVDPTAVVEQLGLV